MTNDELMKVASMSDNDVFRLNSIQNKLTTEDGKEVVLVAYEKE